MFRILVSASVLAVTMSAANAAPKCPPGSIYRVTKKVCVDKSAAIRDGVIKRRDKITKDRATSQRITISEPEAQERKSVAAMAYRGASPNDQRTATRQQPAQTPMVKQVSATGSPFGILLDPWRSGDVSASLQTPFSLQLATQNQIQGR
jgi:hypothetical protein